MWTWRLPCTAKVTGYPTPKAKHPGTSPEQAQMTTLSGVAFEPPEHCLGALQTKNSTVESWETPARTNSCSCFPFGLKHCSWAPSKYQEVSQQNVGDLSHKTIPSKPLSVLDRNPAAPGQNGASTNWLLSALRPLSAPGANCFWAWIGGAKLMASSRTFSSAPGPGDVAGTGSSSGVAALKGP